MLNRVPKGSKLEVDTAMSSPVGGDFLTPLTSSVKEPNRSEAYNVGPSAGSPPMKNIGRKLNVDTEEAE